jgi:hypothetical protein
VGHDSVNRALLLQILECHSPEVIDGGSAVFRSITPKRAGIWA